MNYIPKTKEGILFSATKLLTVNTNKRAESPSQRKNTTNVVTPAAKRNKKDSESSNKKSKRGKSWSANEMSTLIDIIEDIKPCGANQWDLVAAELYQNGYKNGRDGTSCKLKFDRLWQSTKPTGTSEIPLHVARALDVKELISKEEAIGNAGLNDLCDDEEIDIVKNGGTPPNVESSTRLIDQNGFRPATRKSRASNIAEAISLLGNSLELSSKNLASAWNTDSLSNDNIQDLQTKVMLLESKMDSNNKVINSKISRIDDNMKTIADFIKRK